MHRKKHCVKIIGMKTRIKIYWIKLVSFIGTLLSMFVYNFHKRIPGVKTIKNVKYKNENPSRFNKFNIHFREQDQTSKAKKPIIIYFHGGGWTCYSKDIFTTLNRRMADMGYVVFSCNYGLSPKYKLDNIMDDAFAAINKAREMAGLYGGDKDSVILAGDSAGAHISAMVTALANNGDARAKNIREKIKALVLFYGVFDLETALTSRFSRIKEYISSATRNEQVSEAGVDELKKFSPVNYDLVDFPPCFLASGEVDKLHASQSLVFSKLLHKNKVKQKTVFFDNKEYRAMHAFMIIDGISTNVKVLSELEKFLAENV